MVLGMWSQWRLADPSRTLVLGVPMLVPNEANVPDGEVAKLLAQGARGDFDRHFLRLAHRLVSLGGADTVLTLGWEMNGVTYTPLQARPVRVEGVLAADRRRDALGARAAVPLRLHPEPGPGRHPVDQVLPR